MSRLWWSMLVRRREGARHVERWPHSPKIPQTTRPIFSGASVLSTTVHAEFPEELLVLEGSSAPALLHNHGSFQSNRTHAFWRTITTASSAVGQCLRSLGRPLNTFTIWQYNTRHRTCMCRIACVTIGQVSVLSRQSESAPGDPLGCVRWHTQCCPYRIAPLGDGWVGGWGGGGGGHGAGGGGDGDWGRRCSSPLSRTTTPVHSNPGPHLMDDCFLLILVVL